MTAPHTAPDAEAGTDTRIRALIERYLDLVGAQMIQVGPDLFDVEIPAGEWIHFARDTHRPGAHVVRLAFSLHALEADATAEMAVLGSNFVESLVAAVRHRGWLLHHGTVPPSTRVDDDTQVDIPAKHAHAGAATVTTRTRPAGKILARVEIRAGADTEEVLVESPIFDLEHGVPLPDDTANACEGTERRVDDGATTPVCDVGSFLPRLLDSIERRVRPTIDRYERSAAEDLATEIARLDHYYDQLLADDQDGGADRADHVESQRRKRQDEERRRHEVAVTVHPVQLERWRVPAQLATTRVASTQDKTATVSSWRFLVGDASWKHACPQCGEAGEWITLCSAAHVACATCANFCSVCSEGFCPHHGSACHVDQTPICAAHLATCSSCTRQHCEAHTGICDVGEHAVCATCVASCARCGRSHCEEHAVVTDAAAPMGSRRLCTHCVVYCEGGSSEPIGLDEAIECASCSKSVCTTHAARCAVDGEVHCSKHLRSSDRSNRLACASHRGTCDLEEGSILVSDEVASCPACGKSICDRHGNECVGHGQRFCLEHLAPLTDTQGDMGCEEHRAACHVDNRFYSLPAVSPCPVCDRPTCAAHITDCRSCGRHVCVNEMRGGHDCTTCRNLTAVVDPSDEVISASLDANGGEPLKAKTWKTGRDAHHHVVEVELGWGRRLVFTVPHGSATAATAVRHGVFGARTIR